MGTREERVTALLALRGAQSRAAVAGTLWPDSTEVRARANLRTSLMRLRAVDEGLVKTGRTAVTLGTQVTVDVWRLLDCLDQVEHARRYDGLDLHTTLEVLEGRELLPGWYDDWVLFERERLHHRRIRALESLAQYLLDIGDAALAISFAEEALALEPLLESAATLVVRAHLAARNHSAALTQFQRYRRLLDGELGIPPSRELVDLVTVATSAHRAATV
jgi:DNA-binding SARP family transcriptional activator